MRSWPFSGWSGRHSAWWRAVSASGVGCVPGRPRDPASPYAAADPARGCVFPSQGRWSVAGSAEFSSRFSVQPWFELSRGSPCRHGVARGWQSSAQAPWHASLPSSRACCGVAITNGERPRTGTRHLFSPSWVAPVVWTCQGLMRGSTSRRCGRAYLYHRDRGKLYSRAARRPWLSADLEPDPEWAYPKALTDVLRAEGTAR